jgi:signal transduction histidine kinase
VTRLGLRAKTAAVFAAGALGVSSTLTVGTYELTRRALLAERERTATRAAYFDAAVVRQGLSTENADVVEILRSLDTGQSRRPLILRNGTWFARTADTASTNAVPASLRALVDAGRPAVQRVELAAVPTLVVGVPLPGTGASYYELNAQDELERTLRQIALSLIAVAAVTTAAAALLGRWASRRILRPLTVVADAAGQIAGGDLTARLHPPRDPDLAPLTESFNEMVSELQVRTERDRNFAGDVSHELRSPLQTLTAATGVLLNRREQLDGRSAAAVDLISAEVTRFSSLVTDLLELARSDGPAEIEQVRVGEVLARVCAAWRIPADRLSVDPDLTWSLDERRFERIVANLIENAERHGGGATGITCAPSGGALHLTVEDAGPGVPPDERATIFARFGRGRRASARGGSGSADGTGLGLSLVAQHVSAHGGSVTVSDAHSGGARFDVELPGAAP